MKIVILDGQVMGGSAEDFPRLRDFGELTVYDITKPEQVIQRIGDAEIVVVDKTPLTEEVFAACPGIRFVAVLATGYNIVDTAAARRHGIPVANVPGYAGAIVAQTAIALMLELFNKVGIHNDSVHRGDWTKSPYFCYTCGPVTEAEGKTIGIIGLGNIGTRVARIAAALGMRILIYTRTEWPVDLPDFRFTSLPDLLRESDVVSLHVPQFPETERLINRESLAMMKPGAILINTSRGGLIDEEAVAEALNSGHLAGAAVDVLAKEPMEQDCPLLTAKNCIITPHIAWASDEAIGRIKDVTYENIRAFLEGRSLNIVN
ncbi:MAG: D-2-hydroxyacid dehydrogenase [Eubacterium sp.]|nr:D-2-hydroxyacid dehydrogenase [Eubacterium sp.]